MVVNTQLDERQLDPAVALAALDEAVAAVRRLGELDRRTVRSCFETRFSAERMTVDYVSVYERLIAMSAERDDAGREFDLAGTAAGPQLPSFGRGDPGAPELVPGFPERR